MSPPLRFHLKYRSLLILTMALVYAAGGCGEKRPTTYPTQGRVTFSDGKPVMLGTVELLSADGKLNAQGSIQPDGSFILGTFSSDDGAVAGTHHVIVTQMIVSDGLPKHSMDHGDPVDTRYGSYATSPLTVKVEPLENNDVKLSVERAQRR